jgi:molecular chaperone GrpE (heat shock protein)
VETQNPEPESSEVPPEDSVSVESPEGQLIRLTELAADRDRLAAEAADLRDRLQRTLAEFANARRRAERERSDFVP